MKLAETASPYLLRFLRLLRRGEKADRRGLKDPKAWNACVPPFLSVRSKRRKRSKSGPLLRRDEVHDLPRPTPLAGPLDDDSDDAHRLKGG